VTEDHDDIEEASRRVRLASRTQADLESAMLRVSAATGVDAFLASLEDGDVREGFTETLRLRRELEVNMARLLAADTALEIAQFGLYVERHAVATLRRWLVLKEAWGRWVERTPPNRWKAVDG
jgi:hypothetical protein